MKEHNLAFIDIETTGFDVTMHEIVEIGVVLTTSQLKLIEKIEFKIKPEHIENADPVALKVNHYNPLDWADALSLKNSMEIISEKTTDCIMVGQNVSFDSGFLEYSFAKLKLKNNMHYHKLDTVSIAWAKLHENKNIMRFSLRELCKHFGIKNERAHSALSDAYATYLLYKKLMSM